MKPWYKDIAQHMWRHYFSCTDPTTLTEPRRLQFESCKKATERFSKLENDIIRYFFSASSKQSELSIATDCSAKFNISINKVYNTINSANRAVTEERGLIERKQ